MNTFINQFEKNRLQVKSDEKFKQLNGKIVEIRNFLNDFSFLAWGRDSLLVREVGVIAPNIILDSAVCTAESIRLCCENSNIADAYTLLRKYRDDLFYYIYFLVVNRKNDILSESDITKEEINIKKWNENRQENLYIGDVLKFIASTTEVSDAIKKYDMKESFDLLATKLNNYVHSNGKEYYNYSYDKLCQKNAISKYCEDIKECIAFITFSFLFITTLVKPNLIMSSDYIDILECGGTPEDGIQHEVAPFISEYIINNKGILDEKCERYLRETTGMNL